MAKLIDLEKIKPIDFPSTEMDGLDVVRYLNTLPTVDAVEVIRCKDCKKRDTNLCPLYHCVSPLINSMDDDFCSKGESKDNG